MDTACFLLGMAINATCKVILYNDYKSVIANSVFVFLSLFFFKTLRLLCFLIL